MTAPSSSLGLAISLHYQVGTTRGWWATSPWWLWIGMGRAITRSRRWGSIASPSSPLRGEESKIVVVSRRREAKGRQGRLRFEFGDRVNHGPRTIPGQHPPQPAAGPRDADVRAEPGCPAERKRRLVRIKFPRVEIEDRHARRLLFRLPDRGTHHRGREEPEVSPAGRGQVEPAEAECRGGEFEKAVPVPVDQERESRGVRDAVAVVTHREDGRVVAESFLREHINCPRRFADDAKRRRAVADDRSAAGLLERVLRLAHVFAEG